MSTDAILESETPTTPMDEKRAFWLSFAVHTPRDLYFAGVPVVVYGDIVTMKAIKDAIAQIAEINGCKESHVVLLSISEMSMEGLG